MVSLQQGLHVRLRHSWHRLCLRCCRRSDSQKKKAGTADLETPYRGTGRRGDRQSLQFYGLIKCGALVIAVFGGFFLLQSHRRQHRWSEEFIENVNILYKQNDGGTGHGTIAIDGGLEGQRPKDDGSPQRYDPKARAFVDPALQPRWGPEAEKGREKRRLFMEVHKMSQEKGRPQLNLEQLLALPSTFDRLKGISDTTIILNHWKRTTLADQLDAILKLTVFPAGGVWVCLFNSPREEEYRKVVEEYREKFAGFGGLFFVASTFNFKYYGRFQLALQARTKYVWIVDDDVVPGSKFLEQLSYIAGIPEATGWQGGVDGDGSIGPMALGSVGWIMPGIKPKNGLFYSYRYRTAKGGLYLPDKRYGIPVPHLQEVDLLCSHWFVETDWVPLLFREHWETAETGEDYMLAYSLRKYAGVRSYVLPMDLTDSETWGNTDVEWGMQNQGSGATTVRNMVPMRDRLWHRLFKRGGDYFLSTRYAQNPRSILMVVDSEKDAAMLRPLFLELEAISRSWDVVLAKTNETGIKEKKSISWDTEHWSRPPRVVLTGRRGTASVCLRTAAALGANTENQGGTSVTPLCDSQLFPSAWQLNAGKHFPRDGTGRAGGGGGRDHTLMLDLSTGILGAVNTVKPLAVVSVAGTGVAAGAGGRGGGGAAIDEALSAVTAQSGVPLIRLPRVEASSGAVRWLAWLSPQAFVHWHRPHFDILVLFDSSNSDNGKRVGAAEGHTEEQLATLVQSLRETNYLGDSVGLTVAGTAGSRVPDSIHELKWHHGPKMVRESLHAVDSGRSGGKAQGADEEGLSSDALASLALRSWIPKDNDNFIVVLEASSVVSEFFYSWLKAAVLERSYATRPSVHAEPAVSHETAAESGVCLPNGRGEAGAWLLLPDHWRSSQARCFVDRMSGGDGADGKRCGKDALLPPSNRGFCPSTSEALIAHTNVHGAVTSETQSLIHDEATVTTLIESAIFKGR